MKVTILMSTYNGENFLAEQIESIQQQTYTDWTLLIRDDGSRDKTRDLIKRFASEDDRIVFINPDQTENLGVIKSFFTLFCIKNLTTIFSQTRMILGYQRSYLFNLRKLVITHLINPFWYIRI